MSLLQAILDLFFPPACPFCGKILATGAGAAASPGGTGEKLPSALPGFGEGGILCAGCAAGLPWLENCCPRCARPLPEAEKVQECRRCRAAPPAFDHCCALGSYTGALREALHRFKYNGARGLAVPLGRLLAARLSAMPWLGEVEALVPVPLHPRRQRERGYNQAALLAVAAGRELGIPVRAMLRRNRETKSQTGLDRQGRLENMQGAFCCDAQPGGGDSGGDKGTGLKRLLLVDDILTSGATAHAACLALRQAGWSSVSLAVVAR